MLFNFNFWIIHSTLTRKTGSIGPTSVDSLISSTPLPHSFVPLSAAAWSCRRPGERISRSFQYILLTCHLYNKHSRRASTVYRSVLLLSSCRKPTPPPFTLSCKKGKEDGLELKWMANRSSDRRIGSPSIVSYKGGFIHSPRFHISPKKSAFVFIAHLIYHCGCVSRVCTRG